MSTFIPLFNSKRSERLQISFSQEKQKQAEKLKCIDQYKLGTFAEA